MQDTQTLKARIIALLDFLPADSLKLLAEFAAFLGARTDSSITLTGQQDKGAEELEIIESRQRPIRISSPRLIHPEQIADFNLEVIEEMPDD
jgi:hypothetical protein